MTTIEQMKDLGRHLLVQAKAALVEEGNLLPCVFVVSNGVCTDIMAIPHMPEPGDKRNAYHSIAKALAERDNVDAVLCINDSYMKHIPIAMKDKYEREYEHGALSVDHDAVECIVMAFKGPQVETHVMSVPYLRNGVGDIEFIDMETPPKEWLTGAEFNLMPDWWKPGEVDPHPSGQLFQIAGHEEKTDGLLKTLIKDVQEVNAKYDDISDEAMMQLIFEAPPEENKEFWAVAGDITARIAQYDVEFSVELFNIGCVHDRQRFLDKLKSYKGGTK